MSDERVCANSPVISRRTVLGAIPAAAFAVPVSASLEDPVLPIYRNWCAARAEWERAAAMPGNGDADSPESLAADEAEFAALDALGDVTPTSVEGIAAIVHVFWVYEGPSAAPDHDLYAEQCEWEGNKLIRAIWRATSSLSGLPQPLVLT